MQDEPIDFSALDPSRDELRWRRTVEGVVARALDERRRRQAVERELLRWARPVLAAAACLCLLVWTALFIAAPTQQESGASPASLTLASWAADHHMPEPGDLLTLGGNP